MKKFYYPKEIEVQFSLRNARDLTNIQPTAVLLNGTALVYTYSNNLITCTVPTNEVFSLTFTATNYVTQTYFNLQGFYIHNTNQFTLYPVITEFGAVMKWDHSVVSDLDTHVIIRDINTTQNKAELYYNTPNKTITEDNTTVQLDTDDTGQGTGETITFTSEDSNHIYYFIIYDYSGKSVVNSSNITNSNAYYSVYIPGNTQPTVIQAPTNSPGRFWVVFSKNGNSNTINIINQITDSNDYNIQS